MVANILGPGVVTSNIELNCDPLGSGEFSNGGTTNIGIDEGVLLTTGSINNAPGPNLSSQTSFNAEALGDPDLDNLITPFTTNDACILEFDFVANSDQITVQYVFASEEYNEYVCSQFNDVFAFFVSGINPSGGAYLNENVALVPGDAEAVAINNVNNGVTGAFGDSTNCGSLDNTAFYVDNAGIDSEATIAYDGFTVSLFATVDIIPGETYHFKFAIADAGDFYLDSGVFLKAQSFSIFTCDAGTLSTDSPDEICTNDNEEDVIEVTTSSILPEDTYLYALVDETGEILTLQSSNLIDMEPYSNGTYYIFGISYDEGSPVGLETGENIQGVSNPDGCIEISDALIVVLTDCAPEYDCPNLMANIGDQCDDGNPETTNDTVTPNCTCDGETCPAPINDFAGGAFTNTPDRIWGVPGWDTFDVSCATLSEPACVGAPIADSWYSFVAQAENQGILVQANPADPNAATADMAVEIYDATGAPLSGLSGGECAVSRSCYNNAGPGEIERCLPGNLAVGATYYYRTYDASGGELVSVNTKVKTYAPHPIVVGCTVDSPLESHTWTIEAPENLYNIPPVPVFNVRMAITDDSGNVVASTPNHDPSEPDGLTFSFAEFSPALAAGIYNVHAQNEVKMMANGCVSAYWSPLGPGCVLELAEEGETEANGNGGTTDKLNLSIYPNPSEGDQVFIEMLNISELKSSVLVDVFDIYGKQIHLEQFAISANDSKRQITFNQNLSPGIYFINLRIGNRVVSEKLMVE